MLKIYAMNAHESFPYSGNDLLEVLTKEEHEATADTVLEQLWRPEYARCKLNT
jgi:hypothetical protein